MQKVSPHLSQLRQKTQTRDVKRVSETLRGSTLWEQRPGSNVQSQSRILQQAGSQVCLDMSVVRTIKIAHMCQNVL